MQEIGLVKYDAMVRAIVECDQIDEVKDMRDKVRALELYAQQAKNLDAEIRAAKIRIRAERKTGQLLTNTPKAQGTKGQLQGRDSSGGRVVRLPEADKTLADNHISRDQSSRWQKLADIPDQTFDFYLADADKPSTAGAINLLPVKPKKRKKAKGPNTASRSNGSQSNGQTTDETDAEHAHRLELSQACYVLAGAEISKEQVIERMPPQGRKRLQDAIVNLHRWSQ